MAKLLPDLSFRRVAGAPLPRPGRIMIMALICLALLFASVLVSIVYALQFLDDASIDAEKERAAIALKVTGTTSDLVSGARAVWIGHDFSLSEARFAPRDALRDDEVMLELPGPPSDTVLAWTPYRVGSDLFLQVAPARLLATLLFVLAMGIILHRLYVLASALERQKRLAEDQAGRDVLTALNNRLRFDETLNRAFAGPADIEVGLLYVDLDHFKVVNDTHGHGAGDTVLKQIAGRIRNLARPDDLVARIGGDEFAIVRTGAVAETDLAELAEDIRLALTAPIDIGAAELVVSASIGIARLSAGAGNAPRLVKLADEALYRAKATARGGHRFADAPALQHSA